MRLRISHRGLGQLGPLDRIDVNDQHVGRVAGIDQREDRRIAHIAAIPIGLAIDLDGLEQERQAGRGHDGVDRQFVVGEHLDLAGAHIGGADVDLQRAARHADRIEVDRLLENALQRIEVERIELIGRQQPRDHVEHHEGRRILQRARAGQLVEQARLQRAEGRGMADAPPEIGERLLRAALAAFGQAVGQHGGVHGAGAGRDDALEGQIVLLEQPVEHAPGEGAMRAAALQREVDASAVPRTAGAAGFSVRRLASLVTSACVFMVASLRLVGLVASSISARSSRRRPAARCR